MKGFRYIIFVASIMVIGNMIWEMHERYEAQIDWMVQDLIEFIDGFIN